MRTYYIASSSMNYISSVDVSGHPAKFTVTSADRTRPLSIQINVDGPSQVRLGRRDTDEGIEFTYIVLLEGEYFLSVVYADRIHIAGSPFRTRFTSRLPIVVPLS